MTALTAECAGRLIFMRQFDSPGIERAASRRMTKRDPVTNGDKILQALRLLTRGEAIPEADSGAEKAPAGAHDTEPTHSVQPQRGSVASQPFCQ